MTKIKEKFITDKKGHKIAVILNFDDYEELLEDLEDLSAIAERKKEPSLSLAAVKRSLKKSGFLHSKN